MQHNKNNCEKMKKIIFDRERILNISHKGLEYIDDEGNQNSIDFAVCRRNWVRYVNESGEFGTANLSENDSLCVAWRDISHRPPYIEFFTEPRTRFEFIAPTGIFGRLFGRLFRRWLSDFHYLNSKILEARWQSYDLS